MNTARIIPIALTAVIAVSALGVNAYAAERGGQDKADQAMLANAKVTLQQAIATAEQQTGGRAVSADLNQKQGMARFSVEIAGQQGVRTVLVDAQTGQVTATNAVDQDSEDND